MYPVSDAFLQAVQENTRRYYWTGEIRTKGGAVYPFGYEDIVKGSGYITAQCCGSAEIELGTVYAAEMGITLFSQIDRYTLEEPKCASLTICGLRMGVLRKCRWASLRSARRTGRRTAWS